MDVDPATLRLPPSRYAGADPGKFTRQLSKYGRSIAGMPMIEVTRGKNGLLRISDGVTRATRVAKLLPGQLIRVTITDDQPNWNFSKDPTVGDRLP